MSVLTSQNDEEWKRLYKKWQDACTKIRKSRKEEIIKANDAIQKQCFREYVDYVTSDETLEFGKQEDFNLENVLGGIEESGEVIVQLASTKGESVKITLSRSDKIWLYELNLSGDKGQRETKTINLLQLEGVIAFIKSHLE